MNVLHDFGADLAALDAQTLRRRRRVVATPCGPEVVVEGRPLLAFCSNDYLGLAGDPALAAAAQQGARRYGVGSGASHLISGHSAPHQALEQRLAAFTGMESALCFGTGYLANLAVAPTLLGRGDAVFSDALNHASLIDAVRLSRAEARVYPHLDLAALEAALRDQPARRRLIVTDAVFSMDGDVAPLPELLALAERFGAWLLVDDAHGFGVLGPQGRGALSAFGLRSKHLIYMGTLGKAAGVGGAFVAGPHSLVEWLLQRGRSGIFTTAPPPLLAHALLTSLDIIEGADGDARRAHLQHLIGRLQRELRLKRWRLLPSATAVQPVLIGDNAATLAAAAALLERGLWLPGIRPPTVAAGSARLRISLSAAHTDAHLSRLIEALHAVEAAAA